VIDASPHTSTPATIWIMHSVIKASIIFSASGATLARIQSAHFDKVRSVHLSPKQGYRQGTAPAGLTLSGRSWHPHPPCVRCQSEHPGCPGFQGLFLRRRKAGTAAQEQPPVIASRQPPATNRRASSRAPVGCSRPAALRAPKQSGQRAQAGCPAGAAPTQLAFCSSHVPAGWPLRKFQETKTVLSEAGHTLTQLQVPSAGSEQKFPSVFLFWLYPQAPVLSF